jgi:MFS family permease
MIGGRVDTVETSQQPLSPTVKALGVVSLFADVSSEMVYPLNPIFVTRVLGAPAWALGLIEAVAESTASILKVYAGRWSDQMGRRKPFAVGGYALGAIGKPLIALATLWPHVLVARFIDRVGKGLRTAPRDALIAENCAPEARGRAFGFHRSMDTVGAVLGPLIGFLFLQYVVQSRGVAAMRSLYWLAFVPGLLSVAALALFVRESRAGREQAPKASAPPVALSSVSPALRRFLLVVAIFGLGNSSDTFLLLRARDIGFSEGMLLLLYALFNVVEAALAYSAGKLSDRTDRRRLVATGFLVFGAVYVGFAFVRSPGLVWLLFPLYGVYYTLTQGIQRALAADLASPERRATELGLFHMTAGLSALPANIAAGWLYTLNPVLPFALGASTATIAAALLILPNQRPDTRQNAPSHA